MGQSNSPGRKMTARIMQHVLAPGAIGVVSEAHRDRRLVSDFHEMRCGRGHVGAVTGANLKAMGPLAKLFLPDNLIPIMARMKAVSGLLTNHSLVVRLPDIDGLATLNLENEVVFFIDVERGDRIGRGHENPSAAI